MGKKFFLRNDPETIKNASEMTEDEFAAHYANTMSTDDALRKAYKEIRKKVNANQPGSRDKKIKNDEPMSSEPDRSLEKENPLVDIKSVEVDDSGERHIRGTIKGTDRTIVHKVEGGGLKDKLASINTDEESSGKKKSKKEKKEKKPKDPNAKPKEGGFVKTEDGTKRDARIKELLDQGMAVAKILETMTAEGIKVFGPQIYKVKNANK